MPVTSQQIKQLARDCGFELAGIAPAGPVADFPRFATWRENGYAGSMTYLTDHRGQMREDPQTLLPGVQSMVCVGKLYNNNGCGTGADSDTSLGKISRYAAGDDYHNVLRPALKLLAQRIAEAHGEPLETRVCVDTAPLLERSLARQAGLGWIGKNTCLINQEAGSWFFLGEILLTIPIAPDTPPPDRCGTCRRCIDACPTAALVPDAENRYVLDARLCISYLTIEHRGPWPEEMASLTANHIFGCDICQEVCPWNRDAAWTDEPRLQPRAATTDLSKLASYSPDDFAHEFKQSAIWRTRYAGFLRNVANAMGNARQLRYLKPLERLAASDDPTVATTASQALDRLPHPAPLDC